MSRLRLSLRGERLAIGVDRVDYSKGLVNRIMAFDRLLTQHPSLKRALSLLQIATPSRGEIEAYERLQAELAGLVTDVNGRHGEVDWTPIRYLNKGYGQNVLAGFYRSAQIGLVTPMQDGMNLVAKEYVAAQNPDDPGVLVLSRYAGAANELDAALIVNPSDIDAMARAMHTALTMSILERRERWAAMMAKLQAHTIHQWFADFISALEETPSRSRLCRRSSRRWCRADVACGSARPRARLSRLRVLFRTCSNRSTRRRQNGAARLVRRVGIVERHRLPLLPLPTKTPWPTWIDCLLPMMTLGCSVTELERVPSCQTIAVPVHTPRRPSSQVTSVPSRLQVCASAGAAQREQRGNDGKGCAHNGHAVLKPLSACGSGTPARRSVVTASSSRSPHWATRCGISIAASGSVHSTVAMSPDFSCASALRVRSAGSGHFRPRRSRCDVHCCLLAAVQALLASRASAARRARDRQAC